MISSKNVRRQAVVQKPREGSGTYQAKELMPFAARAGALDAFSLPSIRCGKRVMPQMYMARSE